MHQIGVGVLGPVFRAHDPDDNRLVALKAFHLDIPPEQARTLAAALDEIVHAGLSHPVIATPLGAGFCDDAAYLAVEYVVAESLDVAIRHGAPAAVETALPFVVQLAEALDTAHAQGVSHGALHLRDIFMAPDFPRVTGFGVVSALQRVGLRGPLRRPYTAPEQISGSEWGPAADRFAMAAIAYELLTGKRVAGTGAQVTSRLAGLSGVRNVTGLARLFADALADTPERRPASARVFADALADAVGWTGAGEVRQVLVEMEGDAGVPERPVSDGAPVIAVVDGSERPSADVAAIGTEGAALAMTRRRRPENTREPASDWTERTLDRGESEELREPEPYHPRPPGAPPEERPGRAVRGAVPDVDSGVRIDALPEPTLEDTSVGVRDDLGPALVQRRDSSLDRPEPDHEISGSFLDQLEPPPSVRDDDEGDEGDEGDTEPLSVVQARYRSVEDIADPESVSTETQAAGVYAAITVSDLKDRLGETADLSEDDSDDEAGWGAIPGARSEARDESDDLDGGNTQSLNFESDGEHDDGHYGDDGDHFRAGVVTSGWSDRVRELPVSTWALIAGGVTLVALAAGFGWVAGGDDVATEAPPTAVAATAADSTDDTVASSLGDRRDLVEASGVVDPASPPSREFSEATVTSPPLEEVATVPRAPEVPAPSAQPVSVIAPEATVAAVVNATPAQAPAPAPPVGRLLVRSMPPGVGVMVNGAARGTTPLALSDLSYGAYDIRLSIEGYEPQERQVAISSEDPVAAINAQLARVAEIRTAVPGVGSVFVDTRPRGVEVWLDQQLVGETPMLISDVSAGVHAVEFRHDGYRDWATTVQIGPSGQARVTASLDHAPR